MILGILFSIAVTVISVEVTALILYAVFSAVASLFSGGVTVGSVLVGVLIGFVAFFRYRNRARRAAR